MAAVLIIVVASMFFGFRKAARDHAKDKAAAGSSSTTARRTAKGTPLEDARPLRKIDPESRKLLLEHIAEARAKRTSSGTTGATGTTGSGTSNRSRQELSKDYIHQQVEAIMPMLHECYMKALEQDPKLGGSLVVKFWVGGEPDVGGLIESSEVDATQSTIAHPEMIECVRETMYGLELVAPPEGGRLEVHHTFRFSSSPS